MATPTPGRNMLRRNSLQGLQESSFQPPTDGIDDIEDTTPKAHYATTYARSGSGARGGPLDPTLLEEAPNFILLVVLYMIQGVPLGLTMGAMPLLLANKASYTQIGIFSIASYPYSFKLLWSPLVDSYYSPSFGRRKSWIVPLQLLSAALMFSLSSWADARLVAADIVSITALFFLLVLLAATQDIAVDGWALTLLSRRHVGYAATCQTLGMNIGYFTSFTVFLALNDADFCNHYLRAEDASQAVGVLSLASYFRFWAVIYTVVTAAVALLKSERSPPTTALFPSPEEAADSPSDVLTAYSRLCSVVQLPAVLRLSVVLVCYRLAFLPAESAAPLKLLEKGVAKETLAGLVIVQFPCELLSAVVAGRWAAAASPFAPWRTAYLLRLAAAAALTLLVFLFPPSAAAIAEHPAAFLALAACGLATSFASTLMFTALGSFYNRVSDPDMGGAYLTMLNTIANIGITVPKIGVFFLMDAFSYHACEMSDSSDPLPALSCPRNPQAATQASECTEGGGVCVPLRDGFYVTSAIALVIGAALYLHFRRVLPRLEALPLEAWRDKSQHRHF